MHGNGRAALFGLLILSAAALVYAGIEIRSVPLVPAAIRGVVADSTAPLAGACVRLQGTNVSTHTDTGGRFQLPRRAGSGRVTASKEGYVIAGKQLRAGPLALTLERLPREDHADYAWVDPTPRPQSPNNCGNCHGEIYREWSQSAHSRSARGEHFRNLYEGTDRDGKENVSWGLLTEYPLGAGVCTSCHAPAVAEEDAAQLDLRQLRGSAAQGVHCDYCHKINGLGDGDVGLTHGRFNLRLSRPGEGQLFFGPLDDVDRGEDAYSPLYHDSRYCASCHEGIVFGVPVYSTYSEWLRSPARRAGKQCQDCHMTPTGRMTNFAPGHGGIARSPRTLANHRFFNGSQESMLRRCLQVSLIPRQVPEGVRLEVAVGVEDVGHRVPTGFVDRHLLLVIEGFTADDQPLSARSGPVLPSPAGPFLTGRPGRLYAKLLKDGKGHVPAPFWRADPEPVDTRLTPGQTDRMNFVFPPTARRLRVRLLYRRFWHEVVQAKRWRDEDQIVYERSLDIPSLTRQRLGNLPDLAR